jgi:uncharacterized protein (TIGR02646 family)
MRKINKLTPLPNFNGANYKNICNNWDCFHDKYEKIFQEARLQILLDEQNGLCGYTEIYINNEEESHIDHYKKKNSAFYPRLVFDWDNFIVATKDSEFGASFKDNKCHGNNRGIQKTEYIEIYNPVTDNIKFTYDEFGAIVEEEGKIKKTVEIFNLNCESLKIRRASIITTIQALKNDNNDIEDIKASLENAGFLSVVEQELY